MISITANGRVTRDIEIVEGQQGGQRARFGIASNDGIRNNAGEYTTTFIDFVAFSPHVINYLKSYAKKGTRIVVTGTLSINTVNSDGGWKTYVNAVADKVEILDTKAEAEANNQNQSQQATQQAQTQKKDDYYSASEKIVPEDDLPFR